MKKIILLLAFLISQTAWADVVLIAGIGKSALSGQPFERVVVAGYQVEPTEGFFVRPQCGYFEDLSGNGVSSPWCSALLGVRALSAAGLELHFGVGPSYLLNTDQILGGHFQFNLEFGGGIQSKYVDLSAVYTHLSSAGLFMPNQGRDFFPMLQVKLRLWK